MRGSEKQIQWAEDIKANYIKANFTDSIELWDCDGGEDMVAKIRGQQAEFEAAIAPYADSAKFWIDSVRGTTPKMMLLQIRNYPDTLARYLLGGV